MQFKCDFCSFDLDLDQMTLVLKFYLNIVKIRWLVGELLALTVQNIQHEQIPRQRDRQTGSTKIITYPHVFVDGKNLEEIPNVLLSF